MQALAKALLPIDPTLLVRALATADPDEFAKSVLEDLNSPPGPPPEASAEDLEAFVHPDQAPVALVEVLDQLSCPIE